MQTLKITAATAAAWGLVAASHCLGESVRARAVVVSGQPTSAGGVLSGIGSPVLNDRGDVALTGTTTDGDSSVLAVFTSQNGVLMEAARFGEAAPGTDLFFGRDFTELHLANTGDVAFKNQLRDGNMFPPRKGSGAAIFAGQPNAIGLVARAQGQAAGVAAGTVYGSGNQDPFASLLLSGGGQTNFFAGLEGSGVTTTNAGGLFGGKGGEVHIIARADDFVPNLPSTLRIVPIAPSTATVYVPQATNDTGDMLFRADLVRNTPDRSLAGRALVLSEQSGLSIVFRNGDPVPGLPPGATYAFNFSRPIGLGINNAGQITVTTTVNAVGGPRDVLLAGKPDSLAPVLSTGDQAPGVSAGVNVNGLFGTVINARGEVGFSATLVGEGVEQSQNDTAFYFGKPGDVHLIGRLGDSAAGLEPTTVFDRFSPLELNAAGKAIFLAALRGPEVTSENDTAIFGYDPAGAGLFVIAREGDTIELQSGEKVAIQFLDETLEGSGGQDGHASRFNDAGEVAFRATLVDGRSGIFITEADPSVRGVPEPASATLLAGFASLLHRRRRMS